MGSPEKTADTQGASMVDAMGIVEVPDRIVPLRGARSRGANAISMGRRAYAERMPKFQGLAASAYFTVRTCFT
ncbi:hypothetical protein BTE77_05280 [Ensifer adhaerens]|nr:hypothetical protein BTE77_05280 [Ensifer adhaerens]